MHSRRLPTVPLHLILFLFPPSSMLRSTIPRLFLSLPPWRIPNNPPRDLPPRRLLFLFRSFVSFLPLTFSPHTAIFINLPYHFGVPILFRPSHHLPFSLSLRAAILVMSSSVAPTLYLFPSTHRANVPCRPLRLLRVFRSPLIFHALNNCDPSGLHSQLLGQCRYCFT